MKINKSNIVEFIGWYGPLAFIVGFALVSAGAIDGRSYAFQILNLTGGIALALISFAKKAYQPAVLNVILSLIATFTIISLMIGVK
ncbi:MAG TPA: hypothetical protein PJ984_00915 [Candidatus Saccharibacteria bacterium]|jgi:hypothetical protein|nr:hypothetical protein [Patescibacteria group bacterium]HMS30940.1 hypothetical protein [Candidatus Saccharibacteria bacterium]